MSISGMRHKQRFQILYGYIYGEKVTQTLIKYVYIDTLK